MKIICAADAFVTPEMMEEGVRPRLREGDEMQVTFVSFSVEGLKEVLRICPDAQVVLNSSKLHGSMPPEKVKANGFTWITTDFYDVVKY